MTHVCPNCKLAAFNQRTKVCQFCGYTTASPAQGMMYAIILTALVVLVIAVLL